AVGLGHDGINGGAYVPALCFGFEDGPGVFGFWLAPGVAKLLLPQWGVSGVVAGEAQGGVSEEDFNTVNCWNRARVQDVLGYVRPHPYSVSPVKDERIRQGDRDHC